MPHRRHPAGLRRQRQGVFGPRGRPARRARRRRADHHPGRPVGRRAHPALFCRPGRHAAGAGHLERLRLHRQGGRHGQPPKGRQILCHPGRRRDPAGAARGAGQRRRRRLPVREGPRAGVRHGRNEDPHQRRARRDPDGAGAEGKAAGRPAHQPARRQRHRHLGRRQAPHRRTVRQRPRTPLRQARPQGQGAGAEGQGHVRWPCGRRSKQVGDWRLRCLSPFWATASSSMRRGRRRTL